MSFELQLAAEAKKLAEALLTRVETIEQHLGDDFKEFVAKLELDKQVAAEAAAPLELTTEEKQAILSARLQIASETAAKNAPAKT